MSNRRLAAIIFADIAGYTSLIQENEQRALLKLNHFRKDVTHIVPMFNGQVIQFYGDGCLLTFNSPLDALNCAARLQTSLQEDPSVPVRMGIHQGDIIYEGGNIFGNSVNIAARIESMSIPGAILFSEKVKNEISNQPDIVVSSLGEYEFKNVNRPIEVFAYACEGFPVPKKGEITGKFKLQNEEKSIAVLAFENRSSDREQDYFAEGVAEEIMYGLSKIENLRVAGRASSFYFKNSQLPIDQIAQQLKVKMVLSGSVRKMGDKLRVNAELMNVEDGFQMWAERYDKSVEDVFTIQDEIANHVVQKMELLFLGTEKGQSVIQRKTENIQAYQLYLQGRNHLEQRLNITAALSNIDKAIELDPNFSAAYNSKAYGLIYSIMLANAHPRTTFPKAEKAILKALEIDPANAESASLLSWIQFYFHQDIHAAMEGFEKAIILDPRLADTYRIKAYMHAMIGQWEEAVQCAEKAYELDPLSFNISLSLGDIYMRVKQYDKSLQCLLKLQEIYSGVSLLMELIGIVYFLLDEKDKARDIFKTRIDISQSPNLNSYNKILFAILNNDLKRCQEYVDILLQVKTTKWVQPTFISILYYYLGNTEQAEFYFNEARVDRDPTLIQIYSDNLQERYLNQPYVRQFYHGIGMKP